MGHFASEDGKITTTYRIGRKWRTDVTEYVANPSGPQPESRTTYYVLLHDAWAQEHGNEIRETNLPSDITLELLSRDEWEQFKPGENVSISFHYKK